MILADLQWAREMMQRGTSLATTAMILGKSATVLRECLELEDEITRGGLVRLAMPPAKSLPEPGRPSPGWAAQTNPTLAAELDAAIEADRRRHDVEDARRARVVACHGGL